MKTYKVTFTRGGQNEAITCEGEDGITAEDCIAKVQEMVPGAVIVRADEIGKTGGAVFFDGEEAVDIFRLSAILSALRLQTLGIRATRGTTALAVIKRDFPAYARKTAQATLPVFAEYVAKVKADFAARGNPGVTS